MQPLRLKYLFETRACFQSYFYSLSSRVIYPLSILRKEIIGKASMIILNWNINCQVFSKKLLFKCPVAYLLVIIAGRHLKKDLKWYGMCEVILEKNPLPAFIVYSVVPKNLVCSVTARMCMEWWKNILLWWLSLQIWNSNPDLCK